MSSTKISFLKYKSSISVESTVSKNVTTAIMHVMQEKNPSQSLKLPRDAILRLPCTCFEG